MQRHEVPEKYKWQVEDIYATDEKGEEEIKELAENIQTKIAELTSAKVTAVRAADKRLFLMKSPPVPAVLVECGFLSNPQEEERLKDDEYRSKIAWAIAKEIEDYYFENTNQLKVNNVSKNGIKSAIKVDKKMTEVYNTNILF